MPPKSHRTPNSETTTGSIGPQVQGVELQQSNAVAMEQLQQHAEIKEGPAPTVEVFGFRGVRSINGEDIREMDEEDPRKVEMNDIIHQHHLLYAGHIGVSVDNGKSIYGLTPEIPEGMTAEQAIGHLYNHTMTFPGVVADDKYIFDLADKYAREKEWNTGVVKSVRPVESTVQAQLSEQLQSMAGMSAGEHGIYYSFPLKDAVDGSYFMDKPSPDGTVIDASKQANCATFPAQVGVALPEQSGNLRDYMPALEAEAKGA